MDGFRPGRLFRTANRIVAFMLRLGLPIRGRRSPMALLTVTGRRSGQPRTVPVALAPHPEGWILIAVYGDSDWSRNLEAAGEAVISMRRRTIPVEARRPDPEAAAPILRDAMIGAPKVVQRMTADYFDTALDAPVGAWEKEALRHPVFVLTTPGAVQA
jgi:deazaflavin-dependent oxidoreductase (nitroreductase family)